MSNRKPSSFVRKDRYVPGVGRVLTMGDARKIVIQPTRRYENCSRLIDAILKSKKHGQKTAIAILPGSDPGAAAAHASIKY